MAKASVDHGDDYRRRAFVIRVKDGDTLEASLDLGHSIHFTTSIRVARVNCPESKSKNKAEKAAGLAAKAYVEDLLPGGTSIKVQTFTPADKFGRYLASVTLPDGTDLADMLLATGHAKPYSGGKRPPWTA